MESWGSMNNIIVITDSAKIADAEFKSLEQRLTDKGLLVEINFADLILYTKDLMIIFWNANGGWYRPIISSDIIGYSNCRIGEFTELPILRQIKMWRRIEDLIYCLPRDAKEVPYGNIENLKVFEELNGMSMAEVIKSIEREALRKAQFQEIGGLNGKPIDCSTLGDKPVIKANNEADRRTLEECFKE